MSKYNARDAPIPGSSVSETHPGFWADYIRKEKRISDKWYQEYGHFYYKRHNLRKEPYYGPIFAPVPQVQETRYLESTTVSPAEPLAYLNACIKEQDRRKTAAQDTPKELMCHSGVLCDCNKAGMELTNTTGECSGCQTRSTLCSSCLQKMTKENAAKYYAGSDCDFLPFGSAFQMPRRTDGSTPAEVQHYLQVLFPRKEHSRHSCVPCPLKCGSYLQNLPGCQLVGTGILPHSKRCSDPLHGDMRYANRGYQGIAAYNEQQNSSALKSMATPISQVFKGVGKSHGKIEDGEKVVLPAHGKGVRREVKWLERKPSEAVKNAK